MLVANYEVMLKYLPLFLLLFVPALGLAGGPRTLKPGDVLSKSEQFARGIVEFSPDSSPIVVDGTDITLDFKGVELRGTSLDTPPNLRKGIGMVVSGRRVTIKNLRARGFFMALTASQVNGLKLINCDFSDNYKQRLLSTPERENEADWMSFHHNEKGEWLKHGVGAYLEDCQEFEIKGLKVQRGQSGLMLTRCDKGLVWNCDLRYNSALGIGMYRSNSNRIMHNRIDYNVRGYSHGVYNRGQDSAGILMYEQSCNNVVAYNSVTHSGDGLFLWAGQTTMDTGKGGCNNNIFSHNDFSHAPTNGIEATFSSNQFLGNLVMECANGVWGGYSFDSIIADNVFAYNANAIAIEHGQDIEVKNNLFYFDRIGIALWQNAKQDPDWGYPRAKDTRSRDYVVGGNAFHLLTLSEANIRSTMNLLWEDNLVIAPSLAARAPIPSRIEGSVDDKGIMDHDVQRLSWLPGEFPRSPELITASGGAVPFDPEGDQQVKKRFILNWNPLKKSRIRLPDSKTTWVETSSSFGAGPLAGGIDPFIKPDQVRGRHTIIVDEWGPYDWQSPRLLKVRNARESNDVAFDIVGPKGTYEVKSMRGVKSVSSRKGTVPDSILVMFDEKALDRSIELVYEGAETTDSWGRVTPAGKEVVFGYSDFRVPVQWDVSFYAWNDSNDPRTMPDAFAELLRSTPVATTKVSTLEFAGRIKDVPLNKFATVATGEINVPRGEYIFDLTTDDGARLWIDDELVVADAWKYQGPTLYSIRKNLSGKHKLRIEHFQIDGYMTLQLKIRKP